MTVTRKRQRTAPTEVENDSKKPRGRPRVDGDDQSAGDRRRTQIRLAQRAYRQRKESTISNLESQVTGLQSTVEEMSKAFLAFNDKLVTSNMLQSNEALVKELQNTTQQFLLLAKSAESEADEADEADAEAQPEIMNSRSYIAHSEQEPDSAPPKSETTPKQVDIGLGYQILEDSAPSKESTPEPPIETSSYVDVTAPTFQAPISTNLQLTPQLGPDFPFFSNHDLTTIPTNPWFPQAFQEANCFRPQPSPLLNTISLNAPYTFSTEESTFARRLYRASIEAAYHHLVTGNPGPFGYKRAFELSLKYHSRETLVCLAGMILSKDATKPLELYRTPFLHLGGAGMHFTNGRKPNSYIVKVGPLRQTARLEHPDTGQDTGLELSLVYNNYEGEWLDCDDVQGYLELLGIQIHPRSTIHEMDIPDTGSLVELLEKNNIIDTPHPAPLSIWNDNASSVGPDVSQGSVEGVGTGLFPELGLGDFNSNFWTNEVFNQSGFLDSGNPTPGFFGSGWTVKEQPSGWDVTDILNTMSSVQQPIFETSRKISLDVDTFIATLLRKSICLGRSAGFRKRDVEKSLINSIIKVS